MGSMVKLLVNPNNRIVSAFAASEPPLWAGLIASYYRGLGEDVQILDTEAGDLTLEQTIEAIKNINPDKIIIVVMGNNPSVSSTPKMQITKELVKHLKGYKIEVTGLHPSALSRETKKELGVDVLVGKIFDGLPSMPFDLLPMDKYRAHNWHCLDGSPRSPYASVYTSLGCPFSCEFCNIHALYGGSKVWFREPDHVMQEIDLLHNKYGVKNIKIWDECFTTNHEHIIKICEQLIKRKYDLNIWAYARVNTISLDLLYMMRDAGVKWLAYGFESGSDDILERACKRAEIDEARKAVLLTHYADINIIGNFIYGLPGDTQETMRRTLDFAKSLNIEYVNFYSAKAYPGSKIYKGDKDWGSYSQYGESQLEADKLKDNAFIEYFTDAQYRTNIEKKFGIQAVKQIEQMLEFGKPKDRGSLLVG